MTNTPAMSDVSEITPEDHRAVRELILGLVEDARREERARQLLKATASWLSAFASFKRLRKQCGTPQNKSDWLAYGSILGAIKSSGKALLCEIERNQFDPSLVISRENFAACVAEMAADDLMLDGGYLTSPVEPEIAALFAEESATA